LPQSGCGGFPVTFVCCSTVRRLETAENCLDGRQPRFGHEIAVRRYWPVRKFGRIVLGFLDERTAHRGFAKARRLIIKG
jgi:hypothetical protein